jgi:uncharacterized Fe-S cluster-containing radical SAM superfamily protein
MANNSPTERGVRPPIRWRKTIEGFERLRLMARAEGYVMVRYKGCAPFIMREKDWIALPVAEPVGESA